MVSQIHDDSQHLVFQNVTTSGSWLHTLSVYNFAVHQQPDYHSHVEHSKQQQLPFPISTAITQHLWGECFADTESLRIRDKNTFKYWRGSSDLSVTSLRRYHIQINKYVLYTQHMERALKKPSSDFILKLSPGLIIYEPQLRERKEEHCHVSECIMSVVFIKMQYWAL